MDETQGMIFYDRLCICGAISFVIICCFVYISNIWISVQVRYKIGGNVFGKYLYSICLHPSTFALSNDEKLKIGDLKLCEPRAKFTKLLTKWLQMRANSVQVRNYASDLCLVFKNHRLINIRSILRAKGGGGEFRSETLY